MIRRLSHLLALLNKSYVNWMCTKVSNAQSHVPKNLLYEKKTYEAIYIYVYHNGT